jgi:hypothetical protein
MKIIDALNIVAERYEHGHDTLTEGCALCQEEYEKVCEVLRQAAKRYMQGHR